MTETEETSPETFSTVQAYVERRGRLSEPLRARILYPVVVTGEDPDAEFTFRVLITHPDSHVADWEAIVPIGCLYGAWDAKPPRRKWKQYEGDDTWAEIARQSYEDVRRRRELARRMSALGIFRPEDHYAGRGGAEFDDEWAARRSPYVLDDDELASLLSLAEERSKA